MSDIIVSGSLTEVSAKLRRIKEVIANRVIIGYDPLLHEFEYRYGAFEDACPECLPLRGLTFRGDYILSEFTQAFQLNGETFAVDKHGFCRCELQLTNIHEALVYLLYRELLEA